VRKSGVAGWDDFCKERVLDAVTGMKQTKYHQEFMKVFQMTLPADKQQVDAKKLKPMWYKFGAFGSDDVLRGAAPVDDAVEYMSLLLAITNRKEEFNLAGMEALKRDYEKLVAEGNATAAVSIITGGSYFLIRIVLFLEKWR
jgi:hypothetical protein